MNLLENNKTILVTGAAGFIGSSVSEALLRRGYFVIGVDNFNDYYAKEIKERNVAACLKDSNFVLYTSDLISQSAVKRVFDEHKIDAVIHLAARAGVRPSIENPLAYCQSNIVASVNLLEEMHLHQVKKLVFASSSSVYGNCQAEIFTEDLKVTEPISQYAATKSAMEQFCYVYSKLYDIQSVCLRFFTVYGPRQRPDLAIHKFTRLIYEGKPIPVFGNGLTMRDYTYIDDIVDGVIGALTYNKTPYEIVNLGGGEPVTLHRMIAEIEKALGMKALIDRQPMQQGDVVKTVAGIEKAQRLFGYMPKTDFTSGIGKFISWFLDNEKFTG